MDPRFELIVRTLHPFVVALLFSELVRVALTAFVQWWTHIY